MFDGDFEERLRKLIKPKWDRFKPVWEVSGRIGSVVGKGVGYAVGAILIVAFQLGVLIVAALYFLGNVVISFVENHRTGRWSDDTSPVERKRIAESQDWKCHYGKMLLQTGYHIDHKTPLSHIENRRADPAKVKHRSNKVATCPTHNLQKGDMDEAEYLDWIDENPQDRKRSCYTTLGE